VVARAASSEEVLRSIGESIKNIYLAYCLKFDEKKRRKTTPTREWLIDWRTLNKELRQRLVINIFFMLESSPEHHKYISIEKLSTDLNEAVEIEHPQKEWRKRLIIEVLKLLMKAMEKQDWEFFKNICNIVSMKYLKATYSRSSMLIIIPLQYLGKSLICIMSSEIGALSFPILDERTGLDLQSVEQALLGTVSKKSWRPMKMSIYPGFEKGYFYDVAIKLFDTGDTLYWLQFFEVQRRMTSNERLKCLRRMFEIAYEEKGIDRSKQEEIYSLIKNKEEITLEELAKVMDLKESLKYQELSDQIRNKRYQPVLLSKDFKALLKIEGPGFTLQTTIADILNPHSNIRFFIHRGQKGVIITSLPEYIRVSGLKRRSQRMRIEELLRDIPPLTELVKTL